MKPDSEQTAYVVSLLRMYGHADLADVFARRERGERQGINDMQPGDTRMVLTKYTCIVRPTFSIDEDSE